MAADRLVVVTGASGFLGTAACRHFANAGWSVRGVGRTTPARSAGEFRQVSDYTSATELEAAFAGAHAIIHLAARVHVMQDTSRDPLGDFRRANVLGAKAAVRAAQRVGAHAFVLASSVKAVGEANTRPWTEEVTPHPSDPYGISKLEAEREVLADARQLGIAATVLRLPLAYGPGVRANFRRLLDLVWRGWPLPLAAVNNRRSLIFTGNAAVAMQAVIESPAAGGETFFVSDDHDLSTPELIRGIAAALGVRARLVPVPMQPVRVLSRLGDLVARPAGLRRPSAIFDRILGSLTVDISKLKRMTAYRPAFTVEQGLARTASWYRGQIGMPAEPE